MKKFGKIIAIASALLFATSIYFSCSNSADEPKKEEQPGDDNSGGNNGGTTDDKNGDDNSGTSDPISSTGAITESGIDFAKLGIKIKASTATFPQDFVRGFDASTVYAIEKAGMKYLDADGKENDIFKVLKASGVNMIRLRIWNDPSKDGDASKQGNNNLEVTKALAKRATEAGMKYMLDFHFSDTWADPSHQKCPDAWKGITTADEMKTAIADFVESTLAALKKETALPTMVQLGNECEGGILLSNTANTSVQAKAGSENFKAYINAAAEKVRVADETIKIVMHASRGGNASVVKNFIANTNGIDFDYIGLSYYPFFTSHGTLENLKANIKAITAAGKKAIISETSFCWTCDWDSRIDDGVNNQLWYYSGTNNAEGLVQAAKSLVDSSGKLVMGLTTMTKDDKTVIAPTVQNQYNAVAAVMEASAEAGADGVIYWGGDWITNSAGSVPSAMENQAFWDYDHKILDSAAVFSYGTQKSNTAASNTSTSGGGTLVDNYAYTADGNLIEVCSASKFAGISPKSITVSIANVEKNDADGDWWASYYNGESAWVSMKDGWDDSIKGYKSTITDSSTISYFKENGIKIGMLKGLTATVTVSYE
ncbi:MAG: cellulase family glycosylhydrolase [Treponema sp.]|nr:cellulase family glycosylhydrolase [Treponema sp.]